MEIFWPCYKRTPRQLPSILIPILGIFIVTENCRLIYFITIIGLFQAFGDFLGSAKNCEWKDRQRIVFHKPLVHSFSCAVLCAATSTNHAWNMLMVILSGVDHLFINTGAHKYISSCHYYFSQQGKTSNVSSKSSWILLKSFRLFPTNQKKHERFCDVCCRHLDTSFCLATSLAKKTAGSDIFLRCDSERKNYLSSLIDDCYYTFFFALP